MKEPTNKVEKNAFAVVRTNSHCEEEMVRAGQQKSPRLHLCFYLLLRCTLDVFATGKRVNHGGEYGLEIPANFLFYIPQKANKLAQN